MLVEIERDVLNGLFNIAEAAPRREICGLLFGSADRIDRAQRADNVAENPADTFEIDPRALFAALRAERAGGDKVIGHYHSHPHGSAEPSPRDLAAAEPGRLWLILGGGVARAWIMENGGFRELQLVVRD
ncbi:MAG: M67 family metallopeptidase [Sphingomonas sp.]|nr:M67 family metallopeptidase [Sphingomonas sp.]